MARYEIGMNGTNSMNCDLAEEIAIVDALRYDWIEIRDWKAADYLRDHDLSDLSSLLSRVQVAPLSVNTIDPTTVGSAADRRRLEQDAESRFQLASALGCPYVVTCAWGAEGLPSDEGSRQVVEGLKLLSDMAAEHGVAVAYEPLGSKASPVHEVAETMEVLQRVDRDNVGWLLDIYHFHVADGSLDALKIADASKLFLVHLDDVKDLPYEQLAMPNNERLLPGDGIAPLPEILSVLFRIGYQGPFSIELYNKEFLAWDPREFARSAKEKAVALLDLYFK